MYYVVRQPVHYKGSFLLLRACTGRFFMVLILDRRRVGFEDVIDRFIELDAENCADDFGRDGSAIRDRGPKRQGQAQMAAGFGQPQPQPELVVAQWACTWRCVKNAAGEFSRHEKLVPVCTLDKAPLERAVPLRGRFLERVLPLRGRSVEIRHPLIFFHSFLLFF